MIEFIDVMIINFFKIGQLNMKKISILLTISMLSVIALSGCQEAETPTSNRQARLIGNENLKLHNTIKDKDAEIAALQAKIVDLEKKIVESKTQTMSAGVGFMEMVTSINEKALDLEMENELLKAKIKELEK